ncbi:MAG: BamA/TamA family outer membrane protein [Coxiellaceae bacterium]|nr:BamA/TamA family outer membrane protein [Coxiellaceae bacterium]
MKFRRPLQLLATLGLLLGSYCLYAATSISFQVSGIEGKALKNAQDQLAIIAKEINKKDQKPLVVRHAVSEVAYNVEQAVKPYGYFHASVRTRQTKQEGKWLMHVYVRPGPRVHVSQVSITISGAGRKIKPYKRLLKHTKIKVGDPLDTSRYESVKQHMFSLASQYGFFDAKMVESQIQINTNTHTAVIILHFNTGRQFLFGHTSFSKNKLNNQFLREYLQYKQGQAYNSKKVQTLRTNLINSDYFNSVVVDTPVNKAYYVVPIDVKLTDRNSKHYIIGAGYGTDTGPRALLGFDWVPVNQWGHRFNVNLRASEWNNYLIANYIIPGKDPINDQYAFSGGFGSLTIPTGNAYNRTVGFSYSTALGAAKEWQQTIMLQYLNERYALTTQPYVDANVLMPSIQWTYVHTNKELNPTEGYRFNLQANVASKHLLSRNSFFQAQTGIKYLYTIRHTHTRLITRGQLGHTVINNINNLPLSLQLLAGGADSVRGYSFQSMGPGRNLVVGSVEVQQRIKGQLYIAGFYDFGSVSNKFLGNYLAGTGPAIVWLSPVGALEVSLARPLIPGNHWRIQFSMGPTI